MLKKLTIENFALVDKIEIDFGPGLTVLTGETGAGKSIIIGGLLLSLGGRADRDFIRHGAGKASIRASFDLSSSPLRGQIQTQLDTADATQLQIGRVISNSGASRAYLDGSPANSAAIRGAAPLLVDFHSQQGHRSLMDVDRHIDFLDGFAGLANEAEKLAALYHRFNSLERQLHEAETNAAAVREKLELINFQINELQTAAIRVGEETDLESERRRLESVRTLMETGQMVLSAISEDDRSVLSILSQIDRQLRHAAGIDGQLSSEAALLAETVVNLNELTRNLEAYLSRLEDNPERLEQINARLAELYRLRKKYGTDEAGLLEKLEKLKSQSLGAADFETMIRNLSENLTRARQEYHELAVEVSAKRKGEAARLEKRVEKELADLAMTRAEFKIEFHREFDDKGFDLDGEKVAASPHGLETIEFLISTNPNEPLKPLVKIASGGELSRIMLALLSIIAGKYRLPTIIFDEIDTGIGGLTAGKLAAKLKQLSKKHQVITISHLRAIAAKADHHLAVSKSLRAGRNVISIKKVTGSERKQELARMAGDI